MKTIDSIVTEISTVKQAVFKLQPQKKSIVVETPKKLAVLKLHL